MKYDATTTKIFDIPPYIFFGITGVIFASSVFILLLLKYQYSISRYTKIFLASGAGMLIGAKVLGVFTGLYMALANNNPINSYVFFNTGIVFYGGMLGFLSMFLAICRICDKSINYGVLDAVAVCIPLFHFWGRLGCFFAGCCYGIENHSSLSIVYTNLVMDKITTVSRFPVQLFEAGVNMVIFFVLLIMITAKKLKGRLIFLYLFIYSAARIILEFFRGDLLRGVWNGISFSQAVSVFVLLGCILQFVLQRMNEKLI